MKEDIGVIQAYHENEAWLPCRSYSAEDLMHTIRII